jgi:hypothetical protein
MAKNKSILSSQDQEALRREFDRLQAAVSPEKNRDLWNIDSAARSGKTWGIIFGLWLSLLVGLPLWPIFLLAMIPWQPPDWLWSLEKFYLGCWVMFFFISGAAAIEKLTRFYKSKAHRLQCDWLATATEREQMYYRFTRRTLGEMDEP